LDYIEIIINEHNSKNKENLVIMDMDNAVLI